MLVLAVGCADRPGEEKAAPKSAQRTSEEGPLQGRWDYLLCFRDEGNPLNTRVVLRDKAHRLVDFQVADRRFLDKELALDFFIHSADSEELVYWTEKPETRYHLRRARITGSVEVPARVLATFVGTVTMLPVLYDARTRFTERVVPILIGAGYLDVTKVKDLLSSQGMALKEGHLEDNRRVLFWNSTPPPARKKGDSEDDAKMTLVIDRKPPARPKPQGRVMMASGKLEPMEVLYLLSNLTGLPVYCSGDPGWLGERVLVVLSRITDVDEVMIRALLEVNGILTTAASVTGGQRGLVVSLSE